MLARFEDERRVVADILVTVAGNQRSKSSALLLASRHAGLVHVVERQGLKLVHFPAQLEPCLTQEITLHTLNNP